MPLPRINYDAIYRVPIQTARSGRGASAAKMVAVRRGPQLHEKSIARLRQRVFALAVLFIGCFAWRRGLFSSQRIAALDDVSLISSDSNVDRFGDIEPKLGFTPAVEAILPRYLSSGDSCPSNCIDASQCVGGMTLQEQKDLEEVHKWVWIWESLCTTTGCPAGDGEPCLKKESTGWILFYLFGIVYLFVSLAIICDEFFVPSLECFVEEFGISYDVAGATFMAAGGSMPELFTSFIATMRESDIGFAAIVGSAVFNVLFVIAVCAVASKEVLTLTWWPLARDCSFYLIALITVWLCFRDTIIEWWEAFLLFTEYLLYCIFMKFNGQAQEFAEQFFGSKDSKVHPDPIMPSNGDEETQDANERNVSFCKPSTFRSGIVHLLTRHASITDTIGIAAVTQIKGNLKETFTALDKDGDGFLDEFEVKDLVINLGCRAESPALKTACQGISRTREGKISFEAFRQWYTASELRIEIEAHRVFQKLDPLGTNTISKDSIEDVLANLGHKITSSELSDAIKQLVGNGTKDSDDVDEQITFEQFEAWYKRSLFWIDHHKAHEAEEDEEGGFNLDMPDEDATNSQWFWYCFCYPIGSMLYCTLPDVRIGRIGSSCREELAGNWKLAAVEFGISLVWIAITASCLYEWTVVCSNTIGIPSKVAAITILAAGTSVPDLLSSYIVARNGEADMAVSSSIGSNIFDVTVGLPVPWLFYCASRGKSVKVQSKNLVISLLVLILMLASVIITVILCKWKMTKAMGYTMMFLYFVFIAQDILQQFPQCPNRPVIDTADPC